MYQHRNYPAKILLVGEYSILLGHPALAIPWDKKSAHWVDAGEFKNAELQGFIDFISQSEILKINFHLDELKNFIDLGGYLQTNIPFGYGLGSSGSFCAAVFDRFSIEKNRDLNEIHYLLRNLEGYFHGKSSGLDPSVSYFNRPIQLDKTGISFPDLNLFTFFNKVKLFLVDSSIQRNTKALVQQFNMDIQNENYLKQFHERILPLNAELINALLQNQWNSFIENWKQLSIASMKLFEHMIPDSFRPLWKTGIDTGTYYCKLCGAGGGGLFLVLADDEDYFRKQASALGMSEVQSIF